MSKARRYIPGLGVDFLIGTEEIDVDKLAEALGANSGTGIGGGSGDAYTKTQSDDRYAFKTELDAKASMLDLNAKANVGVSYTKEESNGRYATIASLNNKANITELASKADASDVYTKTEADGKYATKVALDVALDTKASTADLASKANVGTSYTKAESDGKYATKTSLDAKADVTALNTKANVSDLANKANISDLDSKANVGDSYTKDEADAKFALIGSGGSENTTEIAPANGSSYDDTILRNRIIAVENKVTDLETVTYGYLEADVDSTVWTTKELPAGIYNVVPFNHTINGSGLNASHEYIAPKTGVYQIDSRVWIGAGTAGELIQCGVSVNSANARTTERVQRPTVGGLQGNVSTILKLDAGDKVAVWAYTQTSVLKLDGLFPTWTYLNIVQLR